MKEDQRCAITLALIISNVPLWSLEIIMCKLTNHHQSIIQRAAQNSVLQVSTIPTISNEIFCAWPYLGPRPLTIFGLACPTVLGSSGPKDHVDSSLSNMCIIYNPPYIQCFVFLRPIFPTCVLSWVSGAASDGFRTWLLPGSDTCLAPQGGSSHTGEDWD